MRPRLALLGLLPLAACSSPSGEADGDAGVADAGPAVDLVIHAPPAPALAAPFPVALATADGSPVTTQVTVEVDGVSHAVMLYRGRGSLALTAARAGSLTLRASAGAAVATLAIAPTVRPPRALSGVLAGADLRWDGTADIHLVGAASVPAGQTLSIAAGTQVLIDDRVSLAIAGALTAAGTVAEPVVVSRAGAAPWGGLHLTAGASAELDETWFLAGGGDAERAFGHSSSQPVILADGAALTMRGGGVIDSPGKAFGADGARVALENVLVSRCDTGGQLDASQATISGSYFLEIPDADGANDDDDNDGIYLAGVLVADGVEQPSLIRDSVFAVGEDDAIDHNDAALRIERVWIQDFVHEGLAASNGHAVTIADSVIQRCDQGVEAGYGAPVVTVEHTLITGCVHGLRYGDGYDMEVAGSLTATGVIAVGNEVNVYNWVSLVGGPVDGAIAITCSMVDDPAWDGRDGNLAGVPGWDGAGCLLSGSPGAGAACDGEDVGPRCDR